MPIKIEDLRAQVDEDFVGFAPNTNSVKPVHIANGLSRVVLGSTSQTELLYRFVISQTEKGKVPKDHDLASIYRDLDDQARLDSEFIKPEDLSALRPMLKKVVAADTGVFAGGFYSYTSANASFVSKDRVAQDGGELVGSWLKLHVPELASTLQKCLTTGSDPITTACSPLLSNSREDFGRTPQFDLPGASDTQSQDVRNHWDGLQSAAQTLASHLGSQGNQLFAARSTTLFACFALMRHLGMLEPRHVPTARMDVIPWLLTFSDEASSPVSRASTLSYTLCCQSISRFYAWGFAQALKSLTPFEVLSETPTYKRRTSSDPSPQGPRESTSAAEEVWQMATGELGVDSEDFYEVCGQAVYDMMALEAEGNPIIYFRQLGSRLGLLDPASSQHPNKRFRPQQDLLEVLLRGALAPNETVDLPTLLQRFWDRYGLVVGGRSDDHKRLLGWGVSQADASALSQNMKDFARALSNLGFAELLADGVLQVRLEAVHEF